MIIYEAQLSEFLDDVAHEVIVDRLYNVSQVRGVKKWMKEDPEKATKAVDVIIRNMYRTLMTRGQKGCFVYCTNYDLSNYLKSR